MTAFLLCYFNVNLLGSQLRKIGIELMAHLRTARQMRQAKGGTTKSGLGQIVDAVSIRERPAEVEDRAVPGRRPSLWSERTAKRMSALCQ
jgi:IS30 family transposase